MHVLEVPYIYITFVDKYFFSIRVVLISIITPLMFLLSYSYYKRLIFLKIQHSLMMRQWRCYVLFVSFFVSNSLSKHNDRTVRIPLIKNIE
jgi:hypothetical protein